MAVMFHSNFITKIINNLKQIKIPLYKRPMVKNNDNDIQNHLIYKFNIDEEIYPKIMIEYDFNSDIMSNYKLTTYLINSHILFNNDEKKYLNLIIKQIFASIETNYELFKKTQTIHIISSKSNRDISYYIQITNLSYNINDFSKNCNCYYLYDSFVHEYEYNNRIIELYNERRIVLINTIVKLLTIANTCVFSVLSSKYIGTLNNNILKSIGSFSNIIMFIALHKQLMKQIYPLNVILLNVVLLNLNVIFTFLLRNNANKLIISY